MSVNMEMQHIHECDHVSNMKRRCGWVNTAVECHGVLEGLCKIRTGEVTKDEKYKSSREFGSDLVTWATKPRALSSSNMG